MSRRDRVSGARLKRLPSNYAEALAQDEDDASIEWRPAEEIIGKEEKKELREEIVEKELEIEEFGSSESSFDSEGIPDVVFDPKDSFELKPRSNFPSPYSNVALRSTPNRLQTNALNNAGISGTPEHLRNPSTPTNSSKSAECLSVVPRRVEHDSAVSTTWSPLQKVWTTTRNSETMTSWTVNRRLDAPFVEIQTTYTKRIFKTPEQLFPISAKESPFPSPDAPRSKRKLPFGETQRALPTVEESNEPSQEEEFLDHQADYNPQAWSDLNSFRVESIDDEGSQSELESAEHMTLDPLQRRTSSFNYCNFCNKLFKTKDAFKGHMASEHGGKPFICNVCDQAFLWKRSLEIHSNSHRPGDEGKKQVCEICSQRFQTKQHLDRHLATHRKKKDFKCVVCKRDFSRQDNLYSHFNKHVAEDDFCKNCNASFDHPRDFYAHLKEERCSEY